MRSMKAAARMAASLSVSIGTPEMGHRKPTAKEAFNRIPPTSRRDCCPVIIDENTFNEVQKVLDRNKKNKARQQSSRAGLLSGFVVCDHCGYRMRKEQRGK